VKLNRTARLLLVPGAVTLGGFVLYVLCRAVPGAMLVFAFGAILFVPMILLAILGIAVALARAYWPAAVALLPALACLYFLIAVPSPPLAPAATVATWLQFLFLRHELDNKASVHNLEHEESLVVLTVDGFVAVGSNGFVYDSSGQIDLPENVRSERWRLVASKTVLANDCTWEVRRLLGSYYSYFSTC
jgi:hypothetical protein